MQKQVHFKNNAIFYSVAVQASFQKPSFVALKPCVDLTH